MKAVRLRHTVLALCLFASLAASAWVHRSEETTAAGAEVSAPVQRASLPVASADPNRDAGGDDPLPSLALQRLTHRNPSGTEIDPFRAKSWLAPPPVPTVPIAPPKPTAPPLPFQYVGGFANADGTGKTVVYLAKGNDFFTVSPGDKFDGSYQLEKVEKGMLVIVYLPLSVKQTLSTGNTQ